MFARPVRLGAALGAAGVMLALLVGPAAVPAGVAADAPAAAQMPTPATVPDAPPMVEVVLFWGDGCPHCAAEREFLGELQDDYPDLVVTTYEVWYSPDNRELFLQTAARLGFEARAVPTTVIGERVWVGFGNAVAREIREVVEAALAGRPAPAADDSRVVDVPLVGEIDVGGRSLVAATLIIGFVDGVNPCSLWVLSVLLALVLHSGSRRRVLAVGGMFLLVTSTMYGLYMVGSYSALSYAGSIAWIQRGVAVVVGVLGLLQLKDAMAIAHGPSLSVAKGARPGLYARMRRLADSERSLPAVLGATVVLAAGVSLLETPCTLGLPIMWTDMVAERNVPLAGAALLFALYLGVFLLDELAVFLVAVLTMRALKVQEHHGRGLKMVSGVVMLTLAVTMLWWPDAMDEIGGSLVVFTVAAVLAAVGVVLQRLLLPPPPSDTGRAGGGRAGGGRAGQASRRSAVSHNK